MIQLFIGCFAKLRVKVKSLSNSRTQQTHKCTHPSQTRSHTHKHTKVPNTHTHTLGSHWVTRTPLKRPHSLPYNSQVMTNKERPPLSRRLAQSPQTWSRHFHSPQRPEAANGPNGPEAWDSKKPRFSRGKTFIRVGRALLTSGCSGFQVLL